MGDAVIDFKFQDKSKHWFRLLVEYDNDTYWKLDEFFEDKKTIKRVSQDLLTGREFCLQFTLLKAHPDVMEWEKVNSISSVFVTHNEDGKCDLNEMVQDFLEDSNVSDVNIKIDFDKDCKFAVI